MVRLIGIDWSFALCVLALLAFTLRGAHAS
jgi:hypothetical protein